MPKVIINYFASGCGEDKPDIPMATRITVEFPKAGKALFVERLPLKIRMTDVSGAIKTGEFCP